MPIHIGLAGWGDHDRLYVPSAKAGSKLRQYAKHFPVVEVDSTFYAIQSRERFGKWLEDTPATLHFLVKAYQGMTGHQRGPSVPAAETNEMYAAFRDMLEPVMVEGRLTAALFQYPPWFDCTQANVRILRETKERMKGIPCALEFRHQSWFTEELREKSLSFMEREQWMHSVCDEPQAGAGSVPTVLRATDRLSTIVRFHGRNVSGWTQASAPNWREVRYLYRYSDEELLDWVGKLRLLEQQSEHVYVIFNNNSGGDAADNAKRLMEMLGLTRPDGGDPNEPPPPAVEQLDLF